MLYPNRVQATIAILLCVACSDIVPVWVNSAEIKDFSLNPGISPYNIPMTLEFEDAKDLWLELELTYDQGIGRNKVPLKIELHSLPSEKPIQSFDIAIPIKAENEWLGIPHANGVDYTITHQAIPKLQLSAGNYMWKIFGNNQGPEPMYGIIGLSARLYELE